MTEIDNLQIKIETSSQNGAVAIRDLASALGDLKKNSNVNVAVKNLNNLTDALKKLTPVVSNANKLSALATALEKLKSVGSFGALVNNLNKLPEALRALSNISVNEGKIKSVVTALEPLQKVNARGFSSAVSGLSKISEVTKTLDDDTLKTFVDKVKVLSETLTPLSTKLTTVKSGLQGFNASARSAKNGAKELGTGVNSASLNFDTFTNNLNTAVQAIKKVVDVFVEFTDAATQWDGIAARFGRGFGEQAEDTYEWIQKLNSEMQINVQQFLQYSSLYATMLTGFGVASEDAHKMAIGYTELTYDIWASANDRYKTFQDAADAVASAIAGEVEPIRRAGFTIVEATLEETAAYHGLNISVANATEAQKSYLRYLTLVDQAHATGVIGTYAKELNTAEGLMRTFSQQVKSLSQAFGSLFLPILVKVMPYLQAFVEIVIDAIRAVASFMGIIIQEVKWDNIESGSGSIDNITGSLNDATTAAKEFKNATLGIDELNVISPNSTAGSSGGGADAGAGFGGLDIESMWDESIFNEVNSQVDAIKGKIEPFVTWVKENSETILEVITAIGTAFLAWKISDSVYDFVDAIKNNDIDVGKLKVTAGITLVATSISLVVGSVLEIIEGDTDTWTYIKLSVGTALGVGGALLAFDKGTTGWKIGVALGISLIATGLALLAEGALDIAQGNADAWTYIKTAIGTVLGAGGLFVLNKGKEGWDIGVAFGISLIATGLALTVGGVLNITEGNATAWDYIMTAVGTALSVGGSLLTFKTGTGAWKAGIGFGISLIATGLTLGVKGAIDVGEGDADTWSYIQTALGSALALGGSLLTFGTGPVGWAVGIGIALTATLTGIIIGASKNLKVEVDEEIAERFGEIELTAEMIEVYVDKITAIPKEVTINTTKWNEAIKDLEAPSMTVSINTALDIFVDEKAGLAEIQGDIESLIKEINTNNLKIALGMEVSKEDYESAINEYIKEAQAYLDQYYLTTNIALSILGSSNSVSLENALNEWYLENSEKLKELGTQLKDTISTGFVDGEWIPEKLKEAQELQAEIQEILDYAADVEYRATLRKLELEVSGTDLTYESYSKVVEGARDAIEGRLAALEEVKMANLKVAIMDYDANIEAGMAEEEAQKILDETTALIEEAYRQGVLDLEWGTVNFGLDTLKNAYADEFERMMSLHNLSVQDLFMSGSMAVLPDKVYDDIDVLLMQMRDAYEKGIRGLDLSPATQGAIEKMLEALAPEEAKLQELAKECVAAGKSVPESISKGLTDINVLKALSGDAEASNYLIGQKLSTDASFLELLATAKGAGKSVGEQTGEGLANSLNYVIDETSGLVTGIENTFTGEIIELTPRLVKNLEDMGIELKTAVKAAYDPTFWDYVKRFFWKLLPWNWFKEYDFETGKAKVKKEVKKLGKNISEGVSEGILDGKTDLWNSIKKWFGDVLDWFKDLFGIHSPSTVMRDEIGKNITDGIALGMRVDAIKNKLIELWNVAKAWWDRDKTDLKSYLPTIGDIKKALQIAWEIAVEWWNLRKAAVDTYLPPIASIRDKLINLWNSAKTWWKSKSPLSTYTPNIGSIKNVLESAWNTAKKWWNSNVKLSIPSLDFKISYATEGLNKAQKAIVEALGLDGWPKLSFAANGGMFDQGSMIWAGENGAEIVANASGGKTGVMNIEQMYQAVFDATYAAMMASNSQRSGGSEANFNLYLDGKQVTTTVEKTQKERGTSIMGTEVYSY